MRTQGFDFPGSNAERPYVEIAAGCSSLEVYFRTYGTGRLIVAAELPDPSSNAFVVVTAGKEPSRLVGLAAEDRVFFQPGGYDDVSITALTIEAE